MVKGKFQEYFPTKGNSCTYSCLYCRAHLARHEDLISKSFQGSQGRAYLFNQIVNAEYSEAKQRVLLTGVHFVADVYCACCQTMLGWKYERAFEASQRYKEGKVIVELAHLIKDNCWDTEWFSPHYRNHFNTPRQTSLIPTRTRFSRPCPDPNDSGIFSPPELPNSLNLPTNLGIHESSPLSFGLSVRSSSSYPPTHFQLPFSLSPVSIRNLFHPVEQANTSFHPFCRSALLSDQAANSISSPTQLIDSSDVDPRDTNPRHSRVPSDFVNKVEQKQSDSHHSTTATIATLDIKSLTLPQAANRRLPLQPAVYKRRRRNRSFASRRTSSSSPSRISLLPLTSEDEDGGAANEVPSASNSVSSPTTLSRSDRDPSTSGFIQSSFD